MSSKDFDVRDLIRQKTSMSADIVAHIDKEYGYYAGADFGTAHKLADIDFLLKTLGRLKQTLETEVTIICLKMAREYYQQQRKAFFASVGSDTFSKLGFIQGEKQLIKDAQKKITRER
jgi:hypothetical protein